MLEALRGAQSRQGDMNPLRKEDDQVKGEGEEQKKEKAEEQKEADAKEEDKKEKEKMPEGGDKMRMKLMEKMEKCRRKIGESEMKMARAARMLAVADILIAQGADAPVECTEAGDAEDVAELRMMTPERLEVKRLKYLEKQAKCARKVAERKLELREKTQEYDALAQGALAC